MVPSIAQLLTSLRNTMAEVVIPALPASAGFANEQAGLMLATLDWLADVQAHAYHYELTENADYRELVGRLGQLVEGDAATTGAVRALLDAPRPPAPEAIMPSEAVSAQNEVLKALAGELFEALMSTEHAENVRSLMLENALRQGEREQAWFRTTGFPSDAADIGTVLARGR